MKQQLQKQKQLIDHSPEVLLYPLIDQHVQSLKQRVLVNRRAITQEELLEQYSFGSIAAKNFDDTEYGN
ncbi:hypothetical protein [Sphingobacterium faecium]